MCELSDYSKQVDDRTIEPDFVIDKADPAVFVPDELGQNKSTLLRDREELLDFNLEVEPLLQVLVGRSLETAQIEVIEEFEEFVLKQHRAQFKQLKESELILTQKQEALHERLMEEQDRRTEQVRADRNKEVQTEKRLTARQTAKEHLSHLKRNTLQDLVAQNVLLDLMSSDMHYKLEPYLYHCAQQTLDSVEET